LKHYQIEIAGIIFAVYSDEPHIPLSPEAGISGFLINEKNINHDILIKVRSGKPDIKDYLPVYSATHQSSDKPLWTVWKKNDFFCFKDSVLKGEKEFYAITDYAFKTWEIYTNNHSGRIDPFIHPVGSLIVMYSCLAYGGILMHASAVNFQGRGIIFTGKSGSGKTTISELFKTSGGIVINDDKIILRKMGNNIVIYNCPMTYADQRKSVILSECYILSHSQKNHIEAVNKVSALAAYAIQHNFDPDIINKQLKVFSEAFANVPIFKLGFFPDQDIIKLINNRVATI
jgi:hypothetical protein